MSSSARHPMTGFDAKWKTPEDYILGITADIWEGREVESLTHLYAQDIPVRFPGGFTVGNQTVIDSTWATLAEFPDRQLLGEDVIWSDDGEGGFLSSHRIISTATHLGDGAFGTATGTKLTFRTIADCATRDNQIYDEWLVRDVGAMVRALGMSPQEFAAAEINQSGDLATIPQPLRPGTGPAPIYTGTGNDHPAGARYASMLTAVAQGAFDEIETQWDRAVCLETPGGEIGYGWQAVQSFWHDLRLSMPDAQLSIEHQIGGDDPAMGERAALRWWLSGTHSGTGPLGDPTGVPIDVMGISHAEFGPWGLRREWIVFDEVAVWKQILLGAHA